MALPLPDILSGHQSSVYALDIDLASGHLFAGDGSGQLVQWNTAQKTGLLLAQSQSAWFSCRYIAHKNQLVAGNQLGEITWIALETKTVIAQVPAHKKGVFQLKSMGDLLVSLGGDGVLHLWDGASLSQTVKLSHSSLRDISLSLDGLTAAIAASDGNIYILSTGRLQVVKVILAAHLPAVFSVCFSACGKFLISGGRDATLCLWDISADYTLHHRIPAHLYTINAICNAFDGLSFFTAARDRTIKRWALSDFTLQKVYDAAKYSVHTASVNRIVVSHDKLWSCSDDKRIVGWKMA